MGSGTFDRTKSSIRGPTVPDNPRTKSALYGVTRRQVLLGGLAGIGAIGGIGAWLYSQANRGEKAPVVPTGSPIRVGVLHSRSGTMRISELPVIDAVLLAIDEINSKGGLLGRPVEPVIADGESDEADFATEAERLISDHKVCTIFGCWTSASRKAVVPVVERHNHLLFYPVQYEGLEQSPNVIYLGLVPNQQILPALRWLVGFENKRRWFLVGSDYIFPVAANAIIRDEAKRGNEIVGEEYFLLGSTEVGSVVRKIVEAKPDLIVNTINGDTNVAFFRELRRAGVKSSDTPTISFSITDAELSAVRPRDVGGDYAAASYLHSIETPENQAFLERFATHYGPERVVSDAMQSAYVGVQLWAKAVVAAGIDHPEAIRAAVKTQSVDAPQGPFHICPDTQHAVQTARVGRIDESGRLMQVHHSERPIQPEPFPSSRTKAEWLAFLDEHYRRWGNRWSNPGT
jgi:urea transport system substrate-binding protein